MKLIFSLVLTIVASLALAAPKATTGVAAGTAAGLALKPEALSAKALLEDLLARRYSQELSTIVEKPFFALGAMLDLQEIPQVVKKPQQQDVIESEPISDLMLGTIDPEELIKKYAGTEEKAQVQGFLQNFKIKAVQISVGLKDGLAPEVKTEVETWLNNRLKNEFGTIGKGTVTFSKMLVEKVKPEVPKTYIDTLSQFQNLAGQVVLALALIMSILLWRVLSAAKATQVNMSGDTKVSSQGTNTNVNKEGGSPTLASGVGTDAQGATNWNVEIDKITKQLTDLIPRLSAQVETLVRIWCQNGEVGRRKLAVFSEAVGKDIGKLPVPADAIADVSRVFLRMSELSLKEKFEALQKCYWDMQSILNLGTESLSQPFSYVSGMNFNMVNQMLVDQNPKAKTLVSLYMPNDLRSRYVQSMTPDMKREILKSAAELTEIPADELQSIEGELRTKMNPSNKDKRVIPLDMTLQKVIDALSTTEETVLLTEMDSPAITEYKQTVPTLAFIHQWPDDILTRLLNQAQSDELVALLRIRPELTEKVLGLAPQLTSEMVKEELTNTDKMNAKDKDLWIDSLKKRFKNMVDLKEVRLEELYPSSSSDLDMLFNQKSAA